MAYYTRYEKLQKYYKDGTAVEPAEYKKGANLGVAEYSSIEVCEGQPEPGPVPGNYTCCIKWEAHNELNNELNFKFNNNSITTEENPWCTKEKVSGLDFHQTNSKIVSLDITVDKTNSIASLNEIFLNLSYLESVKLNIPKAARLSSIAHMFNYSSALTSINFINFDTSNVTDAWDVFSDCSSLTSLDLSNWNTSNFKYAGNMFNGCSSLTSLDVSNWNTSNLIKADSMFSDCSSLTSLDLSNWDMSKAISYNNMFGGCNNLKNIICKQAFKDWCITNQDTIKLPTAMREGGTGTWTIVN